MLPEDPNEKDRDEELQDRLIYFGTHERLGVGSRGGGFAFQED
jgi:hypothetical protein